MIIPREPVVTSTKHSLKFTCLRILMGLLEDELSINPLLKVDLLVFNFYSALRLQTNANIILPILPGVVVRSQTILILLANNTIGRRERGGGIWCKGQRLTEKVRWKQQRSAEKYHCPNNILQCTSPHPSFINKQTSQPYSLLPEEDKKLFSHK